MSARQQVRYVELLQTVTHAEPTTVAIQQLLDRTIFYVKEHRPDAEVLVVTQLAAPRSPDPSRPRTRGSVLPMHAAKPLQVNACEGQPLFPERPVIKVEQVGSTLDAGMLAGLASGEAP